MNLFTLAGDRVRAARAAGDDAGFMMIYVLMVVAVITTVVVGTLTVTSFALVPGVQSSYDQAADAAAQGGLQAFVAYVDANCASATSSVSQCTLPSNASGDVAIPVPGAGPGYTATYSWVAVKDPTNRYFRVQSVGTVKQGGLSAQKSVVGDIVGGSTMNLFDYGVVTGFESQSSATVLADWPARTIALNCTAVDAADVPIKGDRCSTDSTYLNSINWSGSSPGTAAGKVAVCNATFDAKGGRGNNPPPKAPNPYVDWTESGLNGNNYTNYAPCQTSWGTMTKLLTAVGGGADGDGGYFSNDVLLLSNSYPGGSGPLFNQPVSTSWKYTTDDAGICGLSPSQNYRSFNLQCAGYPVEVGGAPSSASKFPGISSGQGPQLPTNDPIIPSTACVYAGPTRVLLNGNTATVTSPQTTPAWIAANAASRPSQCYTGATALNGMALSSVDTTSINVMVVDDNGTVPKMTPAIAHGSSGWPTTGQKLGDTASTGNSLFYLTNGTSGSSSAVTYADSAAPGSYTPVVNDIPSSNSDGAWKPQWSSDTSVSCSLPPVLGDLRFANCYLPKASYADAYSWLKASVQSAIAANPANYTTPAQLQALVDSFTSQGNSSDAANTAPTYADYRSRRWNVSMSTGSAGGCTTATGVVGSATDTLISAPSTDPFYANTAGNVHVAPSTDTSCYTATVTAQMGTCNVVSAGLCVNVGSSYAWGNGVLLGGNQTVPQFQVTFTVKKTTTTTSTTAAASTFPAMSDVTQYQMGKSGTFGASGPGDMYIEGTAAHTMAVLAQDDVVVTGNLSGTVNSATGRSTTALEVVGQNNVHIYHPVKCLSTNATAIATTDPGFCPNDITGLYSSIVPNGTRPDQQYVNLRPDLDGLTIRGAVLALGNAESHITCPQPPGGGGVCGGEFTVDNYNRGAGLDYLTEIGTLAMSHHAPVGQEWEVPDTTGQTSRPYSGYQMAQQYENIKGLLAGVPDVGGLLHTTSSTSTNWHILSVSTARVPTGSGS